MVAPEDVLRAAEDFSRTKSGGGDPEPPPGDSEHRDGSDQREDQAGEDGADEAAGGGDGDDNEDTDDEERLKSALNVVNVAIEHLGSDSGAILTPPVVTAMAFLYYYHGDEWQRVRSRLKKAKAPLRDIERAIKKRLAEARADARARASSGRKSDDRPVIVVKEDDMAGVVTKAENALLRYRAVKLYVRDGLLVRVVRGDRVRIEAVPEANLRELMGDSARWIVEKKDREADILVEVPVLPPEWAVKALASRGKWRFPRLEGVVHAPTLRPDGTVLDKPGYDAGSGLLYEPTAGVVFPPVPESPTHDDAVKALAVLGEPLLEFPFVEEYDRAAALAAIVTPLARPAIDGATPLFGVTAPIPAAGKSKLADVAAIVATGATAPRMVQGRDPDEDRKRLLAMAVEGDQIALLDNVERPLGNEALAAAITSGKVKDRLLGQSRMVTAPWRCVLFATGNGLRVKGDLGRRAVLIALDPRCEHPEERTFQRENLEEWVRENRPKLVVAALTLLRAYIVAGTPRPAGLKLFGSFEAWDRLVRGALVWAGAADPLAGRERLREDADEDAERLRDLLEVWHKVLGEKPYTLAEVIAEAATEGALHAALAAFDSRRVGDKLCPASLGYALRKFVGRPVNGLRLVRRGRKNHVSGWQVERVGVDGGKE